MVLYFKVKNVHFPIFGLFLNNTIMKIKTFFLTTMFLTAPLSLLAIDDMPIEQGKFSPSWSSLEAWDCPAWFENAKFGMWAHWGPQCQAADGDWYARGMYYKGSEQYNWNVTHYGDPSVFGLKNLCNAWKADKWDPDSLIKLYKSAGAQYFMMLGDHHDNFDTWNSPYQEWNSVNVGPKKDLVAGWVKACKKYGLPYGVSIHASHAWTWLEPSQNFDGNLTKADGYKLNADGTEKWWKGLDPQELYAQNHSHSKGWDDEGMIHSQWNWGNGASQPSEAYKRKFQNRVLQLIRDYDPSMIYFDDTVLPFYGCDPSIGLNILADYYNHSANEHGGKPQCVVMGKILNENQKKSMLWDIERGAPDQIQKLHWQTCTCIGAWHYSKVFYDNGWYKSPEEVIRMLVDVVSKNGNLLLNVPVRGDGTIDDKELAVVKGIKGWMDVNKNSIYGTHPWKVYGEGPTAATANPINAQGFNEGTTYCSKDVRFVERNDTLFATIMVWPSGSSYTIHSLGVASPYFSGDVTSVRLLGYGSIPYRMGSDGLTVTLPAKKPNKIAPVLAVSFSKKLTRKNLTQLVELLKRDQSGWMAHISDNTGFYNRSQVKIFCKAISDASKLPSNASTANIMMVFKKLQSSYKNFLKNGRNMDGHPSAGATTDITMEKLVEAQDFSRTEDASTRFGKPKYWQVNNFNIVETDGSGKKSGIDKYTGKSSLMLGVWDDASLNSEGNLEQAQLFRRIRLKKGKYYFGAVYNALSNMSDGYIFVADSLLRPSEIPDKAIAFNKVMNGAMDGANYGITFTLDTDKMVYIGWAADLTTAPRQEFRAEKLRLLRYVQANDAEMKDRR
jgi:alpha-L-fucosidase